LHDALGLTTIDDEEVLALADTIRRRSGGQPNAAYRQLEDGLEDRSQDGEGEMPPPRSSTQRRHAST